MEIKAPRVGRGQKTKAKDKMPSRSSLGKMLKYWGDSPHTIWKKK
jgi:hypothetical protein